MGWQNSDGTHFGTVCGVHDRSLGRKNLKKYTDMPLHEISLFDTYLKETVNLEEYPDWPVWLEQRKETQSGQERLLQTPSTSPT